MSGVILTTTFECDSLTEADEFVGVLRAGLLQSVYDIPAILANVAKTVHMVDVHPASLDVDRHLPPARRHMVSTIG